MLLPNMKNPLKLCALPVIGVAVVLAGCSDLDRYTVQTAAGTVVDNKTGHVWQQTVLEQPSSWSDAEAYCAGNAPALPGSGWRLPTFAELRAIESSWAVFPGASPADSGAWAVVEGCSAYRYDDDWTLTLKEDKSACRGRVRCVR